MNILLIILTYFVAIEHLGIMGIEIWGTSTKQAELFSMPLSFVKQAPAKAALANMGIYNGMLGLILGLTPLFLTGHNQLVMTALLLLFVIIVAIFGSLTVKKQIFWLQGMPALVTFLVLLTQLV